MDSYPGHPNLIHRVSKLHADLDAVPIGPVERALVFPRIPDVVQIAPHRPRHETHVVRDHHSPAGKFILDEPKIIEVLVLRDVQKDQIEGAFQGRDDLQGVTDEDHDTGG